jgi:integrase
MNVDLKVGDLVTYADPQDDVERGFISKAVAWKKVAINPVNGVKQFKENNRRLRYLTPDECRTLLDACTPTMNQVVTLALHTGLRKSEILNLRRDEVNLLQGFIELTQQKNGEKSIIPLNKTAMETRRAIPGRIDSPYVFPGKVKGEPYWDLKRQFEKAVKVAKLEGVTFHVLRHTCASHLVMGGVDLATVREIMRHKSIEMTLRYSHLSPEHRKSAVDTLESSLSKREKEGEKIA